MIHMMKRAPFFNIIDSQNTIHHIDNIMEKYRLNKYNYMIHMMKRATPFHIIDSQNIIYKITTFLFIKKKYYRFTKYNQFILTQISQIIDSQNTIHSF